MCGGECSPRKNQKTVIPIPNLEKFKNSFSQNSFTNLFIQQTNSYNDSKKIPKILVVTDNQSKILLFVSADETDMEMNRCDF